MTLPFTIIDVHEVRGIPLDVAGLLMGISFGVEHPLTFTAIFLADAVESLPRARPPPCHGTRGRPRHPRVRATSRSCATRLSVRFTALTVLSSFVGHGQLEAGFPAFAREVSPPRGA